MNIIRFTIALLTVLYGLATFIGYWLVVLPQEGAPELIELILSFGFAGFGIIGGLLALFKRKVAAVFLILSCIAYVLAALYPPIHYFGSFSFYKFKTDVYIGLFVRCFFAAVLIYILCKWQNRAEKRI